MSFPEVTAPPAKRGRPAVVTIAFVATLLAAPGLVAAAMPGFFTQRLIDAYREIYAGTSAEELVADASPTPYYALSGALIGVALILVGAGFAAWLGKRLGRVTIWMFGALVICASVPTLFYAPGPPPRPSGAPPQREIDQIISEVVPPWVNALSYGGAALVMMSMLVAVALLGMPRANDFFRPEPPPVPPPPPLHS